MEINHSGPTYWENKCAQVTRLAVTSVLAAEAQIKGSGSSKKGVKRSSWRAESRHLTHVAFLCPRQPNP